MKYFQETTPDSSTTYAMPDELFPVIVGAYLTQHGGRHYHTFGPRKGMRVTVMFRDYIKTLPDFLKSQIQVK